MQGRIFMPLPDIEELDYKEVVPTVSELADDSDYSREHFARLFKEKYGTSPSRFLTRLRLKRAVYLIKQQPEISAYELAKELDLSSVKSLYQFFRHHVEMSIGEFRAAVNNGEEIVFKNQPISQIRE